MNKFLFLIVLLCVVQFKVNAQITNTTHKLVIKGIVKDENGKGVPYASITLKDEKGGTNADSVGKFIINLKSNSVIIIASVGFEPVEINISNKTEILVELKRKQQSLKELSVTAKNDKTTAEQPGIIEQQLISNTLNDFTTGGNITTAPGVFYGVQNGSEGIPSVISHFSYIAGSGRIYSGAALPVFMPKNETKGRQYLFDKWMPGSVINEKGEQIKNDKYLFNYDKLGRKLLLTQDQKNVIELDINTIGGFTLLKQQKVLNFQKIVLLGRPDFYLLLSNNTGKYQLYKRTTTKFIKANYVSTGLTESGNNYDEFLDENKYVIVFVPDKKIEIVALKKKSIKGVLENETSKVETYFSAHNNEIIDETFLSNLISYLNTD